MAEKKKRDRSEYMRQYYQKRREELLKRHKKWIKENPEEHAKHSRDYRERIKSTESKGGDVLEMLDSIKEEVTVYDVIFPDRVETYRTMEEAQDAYKQPDAKDIKIRYAPKE